MKPTLSSFESDKPTGFRWTVLALAFGTSWMLYLHRYIFALVKPKLVEEWGIGKTELGQLDSAFSVFYTGFQVPLGILADGLGVRLVLTLMILLWSVGLGMHAWAPTANYLWSARAMLGIGQSAVFAALSRITRTWFPQSVRTTVQGWLGVFFGRFGGLSANLLVGTVLLGIVGMPWRTVVYILAAIGIVHALGFALLFRNSPREHPAVNAAEADLIEEGEDTPAQSKRLGVREMLARMSPRSLGNLLSLNAQTILSTLADNIYSSWIPLFLFEVHGLKFKEMGFYSALPLLGGALGGAVGGWLNDWMIRRTESRRWSRSIIGFAGKGLAGVLLITSLLVWYDSPRTFCVMLFVVKFFSDWSLATTWGAVTDIGGRTSATVFAFNNSVAGVGSITAPILYGALADHQGWIPVFVTAAGAYLACALTWFAIDSSIPVVDESDDQDASNGERRS